jgi:hypothetical protein
LSKGCRSTPPISAAALREAPSSIAASANKRRVWLASREAFASVRRCRAS